MSGHGGRLALVVGPSGAGKDTLIAHARQARANDPRFAFPRRLVTRTAVPHLEDHATITRARFDALVAGGAYTLAWQAHGHGYVLPASIGDEMAAGRIAVCNGSRAVVAEARARFPDCAVILVTAGRALRAERLAARGRETREEIAARLSREAPPVPEGTAPLVIDNSGPLAAGVAAFLDILDGLATRDEEA